MKLIYVIDVYCDMFDIEIEIISIYNLFTGVPRIIPLHYDPYGEMSFTMYFNDINIILSIYVYTSFK